MQLFYTKNIDSDIFTLDEDESFHAIRVLRLKKGDIINIVDGQGGFYKGVIQADSSKCCTGEVLNVELNFRKKGYYLHLVVSPTKNTSKMEWLLEKITEIGADEISFIKCEFSERTNIKVERWQKILISAMKQSISAYLPKMNNVVEFKEFINKLKFSGDKFIAHTSNSPNLLQHYVKNNNVILLIGPEGGFSTKEIEDAIEREFRPISLGAKRLRTETAAICASAIISLVNS